MSKIIFLSKELINIDPIDTYQVGRYAFTLFNSNPLGIGFPGTARSFHATDEEIHWRMLTTLSRVYFHQGTHVVTDYWEHVYMEDLLKRTREFYGKATSSNYIRR